MAHATQAFFNNGGQQLYIVRVASGLHGDTDSVRPDANDDYAAALLALDSMEDVSTIAAPGYSAFANLGDGAVYRAIESALLAHVSDQLRFRLAVLDSPPQASVEQIKMVRSGINSSHAALCYPWVMVANPLAGTLESEPAEIALPPSGFVCGIYARVDTQRGVYKAPANESIAGAVGFDVELNSNDLDTLNPLGINCLRFLVGRGYRLWGARTTSNDSDYKYVNVRRYLNFLELSICRGLQWVVFEPNGEKLWTNVSKAVDIFLINEWNNGGLLGNTPQHAFFVRCDRSVMTQNDLDHGRLVITVGVALLKPAEFTLLRTTALTADAVPEVNP
jgi:phage tail sheath protein FI